MGTFSNWCQMASDTTILVCQEKSWRRGKGAFPGQILRRIVFPCLEWTQIQANRSHNGQCHCLCSLVKGNNGWDSGGVYIYHLALWQCSPRLMLPVTRQRICFPKVSRITQQREPETPVPSMYLPSEKMKEAAKCCFSCCKRHSFLACLHKCGIYFCGTILNPPHSQSSAPGDCRQHTILNNLCIFWIISTINTSAIHPIPQYMVA